LNCDRSLLVLSFLISLSFRLVLNQCQMLIEQTDLNAGSTVELSCTSNAVQARANQWQWYYNSKMISMNTDRYSINNFSREHMGMYQCCYIMSSSDSNDCCAQNQLRVISRSYSSLLLHSCFLHDS
jgi:hypothetical protein